MKGSVKFCGLLAVMVQFFLMGALQSRAAEVGHYGTAVNPADPDQCLDCHYQEATKEGKPGARGCSNGCLVDPGLSHPVAKKYPPRGKEAEYVPLDDIEKTGIIKLSRGKVTCVSCHDLANDNAYHVVVEDGGTALCKLCHIR
ncbi:MAG: hypothetical protein HY885_08740 [Deltaproteobacteria bacterium]|nr:hypothetical protein [Deltaproteobacteria bacterium]